MVSMILNVALFYHIVANVFFKRSRYNVEESKGSVEIELTLSRPSSFNITLKFDKTDNTATGKYINIKYKPAST